MKMKIRYSLVLSIALPVFISLGTSAFAQAEGNSPDIELMHKALSLNDKQEAAWKAYRAEAVSPDAAQSRRMEAAKSFAKLTSPQRMHLVEAEVKIELSELQRQEQALSAFYDTLSAGQKQIFDTMTLPPANEQ